MTKQERERVLTALDRAMTVNEQGMYRVSLDYHYPEGTATTMVNLTVWGKDTEGNTIVDESLLGWIPSLYGIETIDNVINFLEDLIKDANYEYVANQQAKWGEGL